MDKTDLRLESAPNFRDILEPLLREGLPVRTGLLFRSGELSEITDRDMELLREAGIRLICDLRTPGERRGREFRGKDGFSPLLRTIPLYHGSLDMSRLQFMLFLIFKGPKFDFQHFIREQYHDIAFYRTTEIRELFTLISQEENLPAVIHCTAGKDRSGVIAALIQLFLGASRQTVMGDYLATNKFTTPRKEGLARMLRRLSLYRVSREKFDPLLTAHASYLAPVLDEIEHRFHGAEAYLREYCGIEGKTLNNLKRLFLNPVNKTS